LHRLLIVGDGWLPGLPTALFVRFNAVAVDAADFAESDLALDGFYRASSNDHFRDVTSLLPRVKVIELKNNRVGFAAIDAGVLLKVIPYEQPSRIYSRLTSFANSCMLFRISFLVVGVVIRPLAFATVALPLT